MKTITASETVKKLNRLADMGELVVNGKLWTKFKDSDEFKVSPKGTSGDYDTDCYFVSSPVDESEFSSTTVTVGK